MKGKAKLSRVPKTKEGKDNTQVGIKLPDRYPPGTKVMTTAGPCVVLERYPDKDYCLRFDNECESQEAFTVGTGKFWRVSEFPSYVYDYDGNRVTTSKAKPGPRLRLKPLGKGAAEPKYAGSKDISPAPPMHDGPSLRTRHKSKALSASALPYLGDATAINEICEALRAQ